MCSGSRGIEALMSDLWHSFMVKFVCESYRIIMFKFKFERVKVCLVITHGLPERSENTESLSGIN